MGFSATARIPVRPLSYENANLAEPKEMVVDYLLGKIYIKSSSGTLVDATASITEVVQQVMENIETNTEFVESIKIIVDGETVSLDAAITAIEEDVSSLKTDVSNLSSEFDEFKEGLNLTVDSSGNVTITKPDTINPDAIKTDKDNQFVTEEEKTQIMETYTKAVSIVEKTVSVSTTGWTAEGDHYYKEINNISGIKSSHNPIIDITNLSNSYEDSEAALKDFAKMYKVTTSTNKIRIYINEELEHGFTIILKIENTIADS